MKTRFSTSPRNFVRMVVGPMIGPLIGPVIGIAATLALGMGAALVFTGATAGPALADHMSGRIVVSAPSRFDRDRFDHDRSNYANRPMRWHVRQHDENPRWYHANVSTTHQTLPRRYWGMEHHFGNRRTRTVVVRPHNSHNDGHYDTGNRHRYTTNRHCSTINGGTLVGAAIGGLIGSQIGSGSGQLAATAAGTFLGAAVGSNAGCR